ncbi:hypothetical protein NLJ89_g8210 [Agrocybe chaxingu]|uniref:Fungal-type protein kinase domain-containing protein n=1 Tax=Agrocybe chaxingu TaxID=84603 RepID=A0A9W8K2V6_9AGAR|nr:hypothetical protein NLJ89_g8210 [Agrocybe chaxingu]
MHIWALFIDIKDGVRESVNLEVDSVDETVYSIFTGEVSDRETYKTVLVYKPLEPTELVPNDDLDSLFSSVEDLENKCCAYTIDDTLRDIYNGIDDIAQIPRNIYALVFKRGTPSPPPKHKPTLSFDEVAVLEPRNALVAALYDQALEQRLVLVRAPPASGKTVLMKLLFRYIRYVDQEARINVYDRWPDQHRFRTIYERFDHPDYGESVFALREIPRFRLEDSSSRKWILLDEAQLSYGDDSLWTIFKNRPLRTRIVCFAAYGDNIAEPPGENRLPIIVPDPGLVGLFPSSDVAHGLCCTRDEYDAYLACYRQSLASRKANTTPPASDLTEHIFSITAGHLGSVETMLALTALVNKRLNIDASEISLERFYTAFTPEEFFDNVRYLSTQARSLPLLGDPIQSEEVEILHERLGLGRLSVPFWDTRLPLLAQMSKKGWITMETLECRRQFFECDLLTFWKAVVANMSLSALRETARARARVAAASESAALGEPVWRTEFYRAICVVADGSFHVTPEYMTPGTTHLGRIDFLVPQRGWGIEIVQDSDRLEEQDSRSTPEAYHPWISKNCLKDYVMLDFRSSIPKTPHPDANATVSSSHFYGDTTKRAHETPRRPKEPILMTTPDHDRLSSIAPFTSTAVHVQPDFAEAALQMAGKFVGPVAVDDFLDRYLPGSSAPPLPPVDRQSFRAVAKLSKEPDMYDPLIQALSPFCQGISLVNTAGVADPESGALLNRSIKPDISYYKKSRTPPPDSCITRARDMITFLELKVRDVDEPFDTRRTGGPFERAANNARDTRGQLTVYANAIQAMQFRTHAFAVYINKARCRFMRFTRSGAVVTAPFDYTEVDWLAVFFWRLSHADDAQRDIDTTITPIPADAPDAAKARSSLGLKDDAPLYKVLVVDDYTKKNQRYIVSEPFTKHHIYPLGRGTRCFKAYDCKTGKVVLLKDTWRVDGYDKEGDTYRLLHEHKVPHIAGLLAAGDVPGRNSECGATHDVFPKPRKHRIHIHYRLVLDTVGDPLTRFDSTWGMVQAVYCAVQVHAAAVTAAGILHRDISVGNIVLVPDGGILIDRELSKRLDEKQARTYEKTGTIQFISVRQLKSPGLLPHNVGDDLESFVHVLVWTAARYAPGTMSIAERTAFVKSFDSPDGEHKSMLMRLGEEGIYGMKLDQNGVNEVLIPLFGAFGTRYKEGTKRQASDRVRKELEKLESHGWMLDILKKGLEDEEWQSADDARKRKSQTSEYDLDTENAEEEDEEAEHAAKRNRH